MSASSREKDRNRMFMEVDVCDWVAQAVEYAKSGIEWHSAWWDAYFEVGGEHESVAKKECPKNGAYHLYRLGRIRNSGISCKKYNLKNLWHERRVKNGTYALLALEILKASPDIEFDNLWEEIQNRVRNDLGAEPAAEPEGAAQIAFKLWHNDLIVDELY